MKRNKVARAASRNDRTSSRVRDSSGNVFADLGLPNPEEHLAKAQLARQLRMLIEAAGLTQKQAGERLGIDQPKVSAILRGQLKDFSTERLMRYITALDHDVVISIREPEDAARPQVRVLVES
jgi:predicted XRE-type DNA-binding protein